MARKPRTALTVLHTQGAKPQAPATLFDGGEHERESAPQLAGSKARRTLTVGLLPGEIADLTKIADAEGLTRNNLTAFFIREGLRQYHAGKLDLSRHTKRRLV